MICTLWILSGQLLPHRLPQRSVPLQPGLQVLLEAASPRFVEAGAGDGFGEAVEAAYACFGAVGVDVAGAVAEAFHEGGRGVADGHGDRLGRALFDGAEGGVEARVEGVAL